MNILLTVEKKISIILNCLLALFFILGLYFLPVAKNGCVNAEKKMKAILKNPFSQ